MIFSRFLPSAFWWTQKEGHRPPWMPGTRGLETYLDVAFASMANGAAPPTRRALSSRRHGWTPCYRHGAVASRRRGVTALQPVSLVLSHPLTIVRPLPLTPKDARTLPACRAKRLWLSGPRTDAGGLYEPRDVTLPSAGEVLARTAFANRDVRAARERGDARLNR
jgi:hypothetical protein